MEHFSYDKRRQRLEALKHQISSEDLSLLKSTSFDDLELANTLVENAVGYFPLPFALAPGVTINDKHHPLIPMVVEETSVVAGLCKNIAFVNSHGKINAFVKGNNLIGQIHFPRLQRPEQFEKIINDLKNDWLQQINSFPCASMVKRGGGAYDIFSRMITCDDGLIMGVVHVLVDTKNAMGANMVNQTCEYIRPFIEKATGENALMSILSNLNTEKLIHIDITLEDINKDLAFRISEASRIAYYDPYRAVTHNKGIMNGMDAVCIATGNDWRALEAGIHGYTVKNKQYRGLSIWTSLGTKLKGTLIAPINVGIVGGVTRIHPLASFALRCLQVSSSIELAYVMGAIGLIQNLAALRALVTEGITRGHMRLHLINLIKQTDATPIEQQEILKQLKETLDHRNYVTASDVHTLLERLRS